MSGPTLVVGLERQRDGRIELLCPAVGVWSHHPARGQPVGQGSSLGLLAQLGVRYRLVLPEGVVGCVDEGLPRAKILAMEFGQQMFQLASLELGASAAQRLHHEDLPPGCAAIVSPTDGVFYRGATPDAPPFVDVGSKIGVGQPVGLVEVMKTFNQITYGGAELPAEAEIVEIRCKDEEEVRAGQLLFVVR